MAALKKKNPGKWWQMMMYLGDLGGGAANGSNLRFSYGNDPQHVEKRVTHRTKCTMFIPFSPWLPTGYTITRDHLVAPPRPMVRITQNHVDQIHGNHGKSHGSVHFRMELLISKSILGYDMSMEVSHAFRYPLVIQRIGKSPVLRTVNDLSMGHFP